MIASSATRSNSMIAYFELMRFHRPAGIWLLLWPTLWSLWLASAQIGAHMPPLSWIVIFTLGTVVMRAAGCVINDILDYRFDREVARTQYRPLASGVLKPWQAGATFGLLCLIGLGLWWQLPFLARMIGIIALGLSMFYPLCKRFFPCPQLVLGLAWYLGMVMAYAALLGYVPVFAWFVYGSAVLWTLVYDTEYALADLPDDTKLGLYSSARLFGRGVVPAIVLLQVLFLSMMYVVGLHYALNSFYVVSLIGAAGCFIYQYYLMKRQHYFRAFAHNQWVGLLIFLGVVLSVRT